MQMVPFFKNLNTFPFLSKLTSWCQMLTSDTTRSLKTDSKSIALYSVMSNLTASVSHNRRHKRFGYCFVCLLLAGYLSGCRIVHNPVSVPNMVVPQSYTGQTDTTSIGGWSHQKLFTDPNLVSLIDTALMRNLDLEITLQRIEIARAGYTISQGALLPRVDAVATASVDRYGRYILNGVGNLDTNL